MAAKKKEEEKVPHHFTPSLSIIECTGCPKPTSFINSTTATVYVKKQPMATVKDKLPTSFTPFASCSFNTNGLCTPIITEPWVTQDDLKKIAIEGQAPIVEKNRIKCKAQTGTGTITISEKKDTPPPPENIVDKAQNKINKAANAITKKITEITQAASDAIDGIAGAAKDAGGFLQNESIQGAIANTADLVDNIDRKKAELDVTVANIDIRLNNLRKELTQLITGEQQELQDLMTVRDNNLPDGDGDGDTATPLDSDNQSTEEEEEKEFAYNQEFFDDANRESVNALMNEMQDDLDTLNDSASRLNQDKDFTIETDKGSADTTRLFTGAESGSTNTPTSTPTPTLTSATNSINIPTNPSDVLQKSIENQDPEGLEAATNRYNETNAILEEHGVTLGDAADKKETIQSLVLLDDITEIIKGGPNSGDINNIVATPNTGGGIDTPIIIGEQPTTHVPSALSNRINEERQELDTRVQAEIDELLAEVAYLERMQKYKKESAELQEDIDRSAAALDILGDFGAFIDGIAAKHLGRLADKYKQVMDQMGKNMSRLNSSLRGASYMAGGFKAGDVITHAPPLDEEEEEEEKEEETSIPVLPPPTTSSGGGGGDGEPEEVEEEPEEKDECTLSKIIITKNSKHEYILNKNNSVTEGAHSGSLPDPIVYIAGTIKNVKSLSLDFVDLDCSNCAQDHEKPDEYQRDGATEKLSVLDNSATILIHHNDNQIGEFISGDFIDILVLGWKALRPLDYNIPIDLCNFSKNIKAKVYIDAKWHLLVSLSTPSQQVSIQQTIFDLNPYIGQTIPSHHASTEIVQKDHPGGADIKFGVGAIYDNNSIGFDLYNEFNTEEIKEYVKKLFKLLDFFSMFTEKIDNKAGGEKKEKVKKTPLNKITGVSFSFTPPNLELKVSAGLEEKADNPLFGIGSYTELDISSTLLKITFEIDIITFARKHPWIIAIEVFIDGVYSAYNKAVTFLRREDLISLPPKLEDFISFKIGLEGFYGLHQKMKLTGENKNLKVTGDGGIKAYANFSANLNATTVIGIKYTALAKADVDATVHLVSEFGFDQSGFSSTSKFIVDPIVLESTMSYRIQGWKITGLVGSTFNTIKDFFSSDDKVEINDVNIEEDSDDKGDPNDEYLIDINLTPEEPWKLTLYDGFEY